MTIEIPEPSTLSLSRLSREGEYYLADRAQPAIDPTPAEISFRPTYAELRAMLERAIDLLDTMRRTSAVYDYGKEYFPVLNEGRDLVARIREFDP